MDVKTVGKIASFLGSSNLDKSLTSIKNGQEQKGLIFSIINLANSSSVRKCDSQNEYLIYQWIEFTAIYAQQLKSNPHQGKCILKEINNYLENCSYLVGYTLTLADVLVYHLVYDIMDGLSPSEREHFLDVCRWFNHIQQDEAVRQDNKVINFAPTYVASRLTTGY